MLVQRFGSHFQHLVSDKVLSIKGAPFLTKNRISVLVVDILHNRYNLWKLLDDLFNQLLHTKNFGTSCYQNNHNLT